MSVSERSGERGVGAVWTPVARTTARIEVRPYSTDVSGREASACSRRFEAALRSVEQIVRPDDRLCPYGMFRVAVAFGPDADAVTPRVLGERLARAVAKGLLRGRHDLDHRTGSARADGRRGSGAEVLDATTVVTVDRSPVVAAPDLMGEHDADESGRDEPGSSAHLSVPRLRHRTVVGTTPTSSVVDRVRHGEHAPEGDAGPWCGTLLVVDCGPLVDGRPGLAALATGSLAERLGFKTMVTPLVSQGALITDIDGARVDLVVLLIGAEPTDRPSPWSSSTWCVPSQLAEAYRAAGIGVLAVSVGAGAGALTTCIEKGASVLFGLNGLPAELERRSRPAEADRPSSASPVIDGGPPQLDVLMRLTSSERRVLFYLTTGTSPRDIAVDLVVSLTTVRSHIRSILRKLGVRSQLAAVALANGSGRVQDGAGRLTGEPEPYEDHETAAAESA
jgi:DNA-binding CsgD family transcriptional regulator